MMSPMRAYYWRIRLFLALVWRPVESRGSIPEPYRCKARIPIRTAWEVARSIHP